MFREILQESLQELMDKEMSETFFILKLIAFACILGFLVTVLIDYAYKGYKKDKENGG